MRIVLDTNVLLRATPASVGGPAWEVLRFASSAPHRHISSQPILLELAEVLRRPHILTLHGLSDEEVAHYVASIVRTVTIVSMPHISPTIVPDDPKDNAVVYTAVLGQADVICTRDRHLHVDQVRSYCAPHGIRILDDVELLTVLRAEQAED